MQPFLDNRDIIHGGSGYPMQPTGLFARGAEGGLSGRVVRTGGLRRATEYGIDSEGEAWS